MERSNNKTDKRLMKLVREHINERFKEESDPIQDMGIGVFVEKTFDSPETAAKSIYSKLHLILGKDDIPDDIIYPIEYRNKKGERVAFNEKYLSYIIKYMFKYVKPSTPTFSSPEFYRKVLIKLNETLLIAGYPKTEK